MAKISKISLPIVLSATLLGGCEMMNGMGNDSYSNPDARTTYSSQAVTYDQHSTNTAANASSSARSAQTTQAMPDPKPETKTTDTQSAVPLSAPAVGQ